MEKKEIAENRIRNLEKKLEKALRELNSPTNVKEKHLMEEMYRIARELVVKHQNPSPILLQKKMLIDFFRANRLLERMEEEGVVGPDNGIDPRNVLIKS